MDFLTLLYTLLSPLIFGYVFYRFFRLGQSMQTSSDEDEVTETLYPEITGWVPSVVKSEPNEEEYTTYVPNDEDEFLAEQAMQKQKEEELQRKLDEHFRHA